MRRLLAILGLVIWCGAARAEPAMPDKDPAGFADWLTGFEARAEAQGIAPATLRAALGGAAYDPAIIARDRTQNEFTKTVWVYLQTAASDERIRNGQAALRRHRALFDAIEARYGVDRQIVAAIWGLESAYGTFRGSVPTFDALATLAYDGRRGAFFEGQLIDALRIVQDDHAAPASMTGSWAGAMGHTQFMPSSFLSYAVDFNGDGRRDIWGDDPADALASTAAYLAANGWTPGQPWGVEVTVPEEFDYLQANRAVTRLPSAWARLGVVGVAGPVPDAAPASLLLPGGAEGAAFLIFPNFAVLETYNTADSYVIAVGHLADRIAGGRPIRHGWPEGDRALTYDERIELQERLTAAGFDTQGIDGLIGPLTIDAIRAWQKAQGWVPDGYAPPRLLERLRRGSD